MRLLDRTLMSPPSLPFIASPHLRTLAPAIEAQLVHPGTPKSNPMLVCEVREPTPQGLCSPAVFVLDFRTWIGRMRHPGSAAPLNRLRWSHHSTQSSTWVVLCACASDSSCSPPLRAASAHAMVPKTSPCKNLQSRVPTRPLPAPPPPHSASLKSASPA